MKLFEFFHAIYESLYVFDCAGVIERGAEAAYAAVALDADHAVSLGESHELVLEVFLARGHHEADVHERAVFLDGCADKHGVAVDLVVEKGSLLLVDLLIASTPPSPLSHLSVSVIT